MSTPRLKVNEAALAYVPATAFVHMSQLLDAQIGSEADAVRLAEQGVGARAYKRLHKRLGFAHALVAPETTVRRRLKDDARFSEAESERLIRLARVFAETLAVFDNDEAKALQWLHTAQAYIPGQEPVTPMWLAARDSGARLVESLLRQTVHGIF